MNKQISKLKTYLGRIVRDIERKVKDDVQLESTFAELLPLAKRLLAQRKDSKNKLYSLHTPAVLSFTKGKAHKKYEFGCKVSL
jgi:IS5 family transposase